MLSVSSSATTIEYDNGALSRSVSAGWGLYFANYFTNDEAFAVSIDEVLIRTAPYGGGTAHLWFWADDAGTPGSIAADGGAWSLASDDWASLDVSSLDLILEPGESIFAGYDPAYPFQVTYDSMTPGVGRTWWQRNSTTAWALGGPLSITSNLMVALEVSPVPEPASMLALGCLGLGMLVARKAKRHH